MKKIILLILFFAITSFSNAQMGIIPYINKYKSATLYFRDGTIKEGLAKITVLDEKIKFKKNKKSKKSIYDYSKIDKIIILETKGFVTYQYKIIKKKNVKKPQYPLLKILEKGSLSLYSIEQTGTITSPGLSGYDVNMNGKNVHVASTKGMSTYFSSKSYYISKGNSTEVFSINNTNILGGKFIKSASKYFKDCPELVKKIESKEFRRNDIIGIVQYYNQNCGNTKN